MMLSKGRLPRKEFIKNEYKKIDKMYHKEIGNRRLIKEAMEKFRLDMGLQTSKGSGNKDLMEIADLEDECLIILKDLSIRNSTRANKLMPEAKANNQSMVLERIYQTLARSNVGPALFRQIVKRNSETEKVL